MKKRETLNFYFHVEFDFNEDSGIPKDTQVIYNEIIQLLENTDLISELKLQEIFPKISFEVYKNVRNKTHLIWDRIANEPGIHFYQQIPIKPILHFYRSTNTVNVFRIHDFFPLQYPKLYSLKSRVAFKRRLSYIRNGDVFLANSEETRKALSEFSTRVSETRVIPCKVPSFGSNQSIKYELESTLLPHPDKFILNVGVISKRKATLSLISFWERELMHLGYSLILVGNILDKKYFNGVKIKTEKYLNADAKIICLRRVSSNELAKLYEKANGYISSSSFEGFNIPLHDAIISGIPILCHPFAVKDDSLRNFAVQNNTYFEFENFKSFVEKISTNTRPNKSVLKEIQALKASEFSNLIRNFVIDVIDRWKNIAIK